MKKIFFLALFVALGSLAGGQKAEAALTVTCYTNCSPVYANHVGVVTLDLQCNASSPLSYTAQLTVNGVSTPVNTKSCPIPTGTISVSSNVSASWTITGPATLPDAGTTKSYSAQPLGTYSLAWGPVAGYTAPAPQAPLALSTGGTISFVGNYVALTPTATLTISQNPVTAGAQPSISWSSTNATSCTAGGPWSNAGTLSGSGLTNPITADTTFTFQCAGINGTSPLQSVNVAVSTVVCSIGLAYNPTTQTCVACSNGGCSGPGGNTTNPSGGLFCNNGGTNVPTCTAPAPAATCALPWGGMIASGYSIAAYQSPSVVSPATCTSQTRTCTNGTLSGSYTNQSCVVTTPAPVSCTTPWGTTIASGASVPAYQFIAVTSPKTCASISENRTCTNGSLSGSFVNENCKVQPTFNAF